MRMLLTSVAALAAILAVAAPAGAETLKAVPAKLDPAKAYILLEYRLMPNTMAGFPGSRKTLPLTTGLTFARYDPALSDIRGMGRAEANPVPGKRGPIEAFRNREIVRGDAARLHLIEVEPDTYVIQAWGDTSFSLGSYAFTLEPGTVTDLGVATAAVDWAEGDKAATMGDVFKGALLGGLIGKKPAIAPTRVSFRPRGSSDIAIPAALPSARVRPVAFTADAKFGNYLGGLVNRIEGVNARLKDGSMSSTRAGANAQR